jgi:hypothetical protein
MTYFQAVLQHIPGGTGITMKNFIQNHRSPSQNIKTWNHQHMKQECCDFHCRATCSSQEQQSSRKSLVVWYLLNSLLHMDVGLRWKSTSTTN